MSKNNFRNITISCLLSTILMSCSKGTYKSNQNASGHSPGKTDAASTADSDANSVASSEFFQAGKSLDLYVVLDKSASLFHAKTTIKDTQAFDRSLGSDPDCKRFDALKFLIMSLDEKFKGDEQLRLTVVTFSDDASSLGKYENVLDDTENNINNLRLGVCEMPPGLEPYTGKTKYSKGISRILEIQKENIKKSELDLQTLLFFSDGAPNDDEVELRGSLNRLREVFPKRVFGVLLGSPPDKCSLTKADGTQKKTTIECMLEVVDFNPKRLRQAGNAEQLLTEMGSLIEK